jgi:hypothetical protein
MLAPLWFSSLPSASRNASAPANEIVFAARDALEQVASVSQFDGVGVFLQVILARDRPQHLGGALMAFSITPSSLPGMSRLIAMTGLSFASNRLDNCLDNYNALGDADRAQIAVPAFDRMFLGVAVAAEQLHAVKPICMPLSVPSRLASAASRANDRPCSARDAPRHVIRRRPSSSMAMLAVMNATACGAAIGSPNAWRSLM